MNVCRYCEHNNREGDLICNSCGRRLSESTVLQTRIVEKSTKPIDSHWHGSSQFTHDTQIVLFVNDVSDPMVLPIKERLVLGRAKTDFYPDVDLSAFEALEQGVSSQHAMLERRDDQLVIIDLASANGTFLNRQKLQPHQPAIVRDGAEVYMGLLTIRLYFENIAVGPLKNQS